MSGRPLPPGRHGFRDVAVGDHLVTGARLVTAALIDRFAEMTGDHFAIHMSDDAAQDYGFPRRVAHGLLVLSLIDGLKNQAPVQFDAIASLGWDWSFLRPVFVGDALSARISVDGKRPTRDPARGILRLGFEVFRQEGDVVQRGTNTLMVRCGTGPDPA